MAAKVPPRTGQQVSIGQVAEYYGVHHRTVRRWLDDGLITAYKLAGKTIRLDFDQVRQQLESEFGGPAGAALRNGNGGAA